jgi:hypothetical protein
VTEEEVSEAFGHFCEGESPLIVVYDTPKGRCGFLSGWYEHQRIDKRIRRESALQAPPVLVNSWARVDLIRGGYAAQKRPSANGAKDPEDGVNTGFRQALRWYAHLLAEKPKEARNILRGITRESRVIPAQEGTGVKGIKGEEIKGLAPPPADAAPAKESAPPKEKTPTPIQAVLEEAWTHCGLDGKPNGAGYSGCVKVVQAHTTEKVRQWIAATASSPPRMGEGGAPMTWFARVLGDAMRRPWEWDGSRDGGNGFRKPSGRVLPAKPEEYTTDWGDEA